MDHAHYSCVSETKLISVTSKPSDIQDVAARLDTILWDMVQKATGLHIPLVEEGGGVECVLDVPVRGMSGYSFQSWLV